MPAVAPHPEAGSRRVLAALGSIACEVRPRPRDGGAAIPDWERLIYGQRKVRNLCREVLAARDLPQAERASIQERIARIEARSQAWRARTRPPIASKKPHERAARPTKGIVS
jgi:hypothetical protein